MATVLQHPRAMIKQWPSYIDLLGLHRSHPERYPYLLASTSKSNTSQDRYDILFGFPQGSFSLWPDGLKANRLTINENSFLNTLDDLWADARGEYEHEKTDLPFSGGWFIYLAYELAGEIEPSLQLVMDDTSAIPLAIASRIPVAIVNDRHQQQSWLTCESQFVELYPELVNDIERLSTDASTHKEISIPLYEESADKFIQAVTKVKDYIRDGDVFQVNLSRQWIGDKHQDISTDVLFSNLANTNPAPFAGLAKFNEAAIISSSPERLVRTNKDNIETRPIAGTRPRGADEDADKLNLDELIGHPKERAEHVMLIDLERNDLGRVCVPGSIRVNELMVLETYAHVHHIVSNVQGKLKPGSTPGDVIRAVFPGGTITGCPKVRCMEIISELEQTTRGPYTGSMGYLNHNGDMDLNILIRTIVVDKGQVSFRAGAGLVADSIAENEVHETRAKARGMLLSLQGDTS